MIELCVTTPEQPAFHVKEPDAPAFYAIVSFKPGHADPERDAMTITVFREEEYEEVSETVLAGRPGLLEWYVEHVGFSPDEDIQASTPIQELIERVASHILLRAAESVGTGASPFDELRTFSDVRAMLGRVTSHKELAALNDAVDERFMRDRQQLVMSDADWEQWTRLVREKSAEIGDIAAVR